MEYLEEMIDTNFNRYSRTEYYCEVIGDTIFQDSKFYIVIEKCNVNNKTIGFFFERIDSLTASIYLFVDADGVWPRQRLIDRLNVSLYFIFSEFFRFILWLARISLERNALDTLFNKYVPILRFVVHDLMWGYEYSFAQYMGLISARAITPEATFY